MNPFALSHLTAARLSFVHFPDLAAGLGCGGGETRNDLALTQIGRAAALTSGSEDGEAA